MIACTISIKNGFSVKLDAQYDVSVGTATYVVTVAGPTPCEIYTKMEFNNFLPAANVYKTMREVVENDGRVADRLNAVVRGARVLGYHVMEGK